MHSLTLFSPVSQNSGGVGCTGAGWPRLQPQSIVWIQAWFNPILTCIPEQWRSWVATAPIPEHSLESFLV
jgi:hypothetical protein